ncbi:SDR family oxidoreductase [Nesterenkonia haasae]|uniref:SDR family oxidoreductase n=1 Tax=Nesterenkonia haasae TaxID=2587813 RepID=UPI001391A3E7|nr:SDR family oxidoreductase [Nesterenkonia haasae]NDK30233.1 SDR family oxidoreductase [Nesterenkonia haasae]
MATHTEGPAHKTALVTGASSGIGREVARQLAGLEWRVIAIARSEDSLKQLAAEAPGVEPRPADLTRFPYPDLVPDRVDALVHAAGVVPIGSVERATPEDWHSAFTLNVTAGAELVRQALPKLRQHRGTVVFVNSGAGVTPLPRNTLYGATKHALRALANGLRQEEESNGVRVTSVFPGPTDTPLFTGDVDRSELIKPATVARAIIDAITATDDTQLTEIQVRPRRELSW